nr:hypothetical protein [Tanacetum cinerariifolium]
MQTRSSSRLASDQSSNPTSSTNPNLKGRNRRHSKQRIEKSNLEEHSHPVVTMADQRTMAELLRAPTEGYAEAIVIPLILAEQFELKHSLINMMTMDNPHDHIRWGSLPVARKRTPRSIHTWENLDRYKDLLRACPHHSFTELHQLDTVYNALNPADQDSLNVSAGGNLLERSTQDVLTIIKNKSKVCNSQSKPVVSQVKACDVNSNSSEIAKLTHAVNQQTSAMTTAMTAILKQFQATPPPAPVKAIEEICVTCGGAHPYYQCLAAGGNTFPELRDNIQGYVSAAAGNYNQGNPGYCPPSMANQIRPPGFAQPNVQNNQNRFGPPQGFNRGNEQSYQAPTPQNQNVHLNELEKVKRMNEANMKAMQTQIDMVKNDLRNEMKSSIQTSLSNQTNEINNMMASLLQMNIASTSGSGSLPSNTVANLKGELKAITTRSSLVIDGPIELADELALITFPLKYDDGLQFDVKSDLKKIEFLLHQDIDSSFKDSIDQSNLPNLADNFVDSMPEMFTDEHVLDYSSPLIFDEYDDDFLEVESDTEKVYDDPFDSKGEKIKESKLLIDELDLPCDFLPPSEDDSFISQDFSRVDAKPSTNNEDKVNNPGILIQEKPFEIITHVIQDKKLVISNASLVLEDFDLPFYEPLFFKEVPSIPGNVKTHAEGFCPPVFISSASLGNHVTDTIKKGQDPSKTGQNRAENRKRGKVNSQKSTKSQTRQNQSQRNQKVKENKEERLKLPISKVVYKEGTEFDKY